MEPSGLEFRLLGELDVRRDGRPVAQPPSKKTRALLAYLVLTGRKHRREALCNLLWDVTDDPRGALRWSLSKLRKQVDDGAVQRIRTDRERVGFEPAGAYVDVLEMRRELAIESLSEVATERLEAWCSRCSGQLLEGLDLPDFDTYQAWLVAEREQTRKLRAAVLAQLVQRLEDRPAQALTHARTWTQVDPMSAEARISLLRLALLAGQLEEAKRQYRSAQRLFSELDPSKERQLTAQWHALRTAGPQAGEESVLESEPAPAAAATSPTRELSLKLASQLPLIGREREREHLQSCLSEVMRTRRAQLVLVTGEPGIGKSRLIDEVMYVARTRGHAVLDGAAFEGETGRPYGPWIDALRKLPRGRLGETARDKLAPLLEGSADTPMRSREVLFSGVVEVLTALAATQAPVLVVLEDAHWLDEGSAELLHYTARMQCEQPLLFVLTAREAELCDQQAVQRVLRSLRRDVRVHELALSRLTADDTAELVRHIDEEVDVERLFLHSGGNPLFALELARSGGVPERASTVAEAVRERVERLNPEAGDVLRWGAVLGSVIPTGPLAKLSSLSPDAQLRALEELERHALVRLEPATGYAFAHDVVRRVVYADLSQPRRTLMHRRAAEALRSLSGEQDGGVDEASIADIARHAALAEDHALAASAYVAAGRRCLKLFASENAASLARKGLRHARQLPERERVQKTLELLDVQLWARRPDDQGAFCRQVEELSDIALQHGDVEHARLGFHMVSHVRWESGDWHEARKQTLKAEQVVRSGDGTERVEALSEAARCLALLDRDMSQAAAMLAEAQVRAKHLGYESATLKDALGMLKMHRGEYEEAEALFEQSQLMSRAQSQRYAETLSLLNRFELSFDTGRYADALELSRDAQRLADKTREGSEGPFARALTHLAELALDHEGAKERLEVALEELRVADAKHRLIYALSRAAAVQLDAGQFLEARRLAEEALELSRFMERASEIVVALSVLAKTQRALGDQAGYAQSKRQLAQDPVGKVSAFAARIRASLQEE